MTTAFNYTTQHEDKDECAKSELFENKNVFVVVVFLTFFFISDLLYSQLMESISIRTNLAEELDNCDNNQRKVQYFLGLIYTDEAIKKNKLVKKQLNLNRVKTYDSAFNHIGVTLPEIKLKDVTDALWKADVNNHKTVRWLVEQFKDQDAPHMQMNGNSSFTSLHNGDVQNSYMALNLAEAVV